MPITTALISAIDDEIVRLTEVRTFTRPAPGEEVIPIAVSRVITSRVARAHNLTRHVVSIVGSQII